VCTGATLNVPENRPLNTVLLTVSAADPDTGAVLTYSVAGSSHPSNGSLYGVNSAGQVFARGVISYEDAPSIYTLTLLVTDSGGLSAQLDVPVAVGDLNDQPTLGSQPLDLYVDENVYWPPYPWPSRNLSDVVGRLNLTDEDGDNVQCFIIGGTLRNYFSNPVFVLDRFTGVITMNSTLPMFEQVLRWPLCTAPSACVCYCVLFCVLSLSGRVAACF
jgi:hypothetical protein